MAIETELKLRIAPGQLARLKRHTLLKSLAVTRPVTRRLYNIYFDTPKLALHKSRMALRLRRAGRQWLQTLKGGGSVKGGLHERNEWEVPVGGPVLDFSFPEMAEWDEHLPPPLRKKLRPVFVTDFTRNSRMLKYRDAQIELCIDQGEVSTEQHCLTICELELELKSGEPRRLFELALVMLDVVPLELEVVNKAQYGYRLLSGYVDEPAKAVVPDIAPAATLADVLQTQIWSCLLHLQSNLRGAMGSDDAEYLHQMRVALRRLRVALRMAEKYRADAQLAALYGEVSALCAALGRIRDWDVFIAQTMWPMCKRMAGHQGLQVLLADCEQKRTDSYSALRSEAQAHELQRLILRFSIWMNGGYWQPSGEPVPARDFATGRLRKLAKRLSSAGRQLNSVDAQRLHAMRILAKKLRYSAEFFSGLYDGQRARKFLAALSEVQDVLGQINDVAVAHRLLVELADDAGQPASQEAITLAKGWIAHDLSHQFAELQGSLRRFRKLSAFWDA
ncbi:MAG TPA: CHAD domain-containing protein [Gallionella sp.]